MFSYNRLRGRKLLSPIPYTNISSVHARYVNLQIKVPHRTVMFNTNPDKSTPDPQKKNQTYTKLHQKHGTHNIIIVIDIPPI